MFLSSLKLIGWSVFKLYPQMTFGHSKWLPFRKVKVISGNIILHFVLPLGTFEIDQRNRFHVISKNVQKLKFWTFKMATSSQGQGHFRTYTILHSVLPPKYVCATFEVNQRNHFEVMSNKSHLALGCKRSSVFSHQSLH
jgi:hypothetical protein